MAETDAQLRELVQFLRDRNPQVRQIALSHLLPQTPQGSPHRSIFFSGLQAGGLQAKPTESAIIRDLKLLCRDHLNIAHDAFRALVNLSDSPLLLAPLSETLFLTFLVSYIINPSSILADLASMLLSNLTSSSAACYALLSLHISVIPDPSHPNGFYAVQSRCSTSSTPEPYPSGEQRDVLALPLLLDAFVQGAQAQESADLSKRTRKGDLHFLASVFANLTTAPAGRSFFFQARPTNFLKPASALEYPLAKIVPFTEHKDTIRRGGVTSTIKNCAFHTAGHKALLTLESSKIAVPPSQTEAPGIDALPCILLPLAGPEELDLEDQEKLPSALQLLPPSKIREPDQVLRLTHVETLLLLCYSRWGRDFLRDNGVYEIVRAAHEAEQVDKISEHIERLVTLLKGEEPDNPTELEEDVEVGEIEEGLPMVENARDSTTGGKGEDDDDDDDEDNRIEEV